MPTREPQGRIYQLDVRPIIPEPLARLEELAANLWYSWHQPTRALFAPLDPGLWARVGQNPTLFLRQIEQRILDQAATDEVYLSRFAQALSAYDSYHRAQPSDPIEGFNQSDLIAYFCAEYGLHQSLPIYSGGLGILAGHHCKAASDLRLPFVGVGLMYRMGYFDQTIDANGQQVASYQEANFHELPATPALTPDGEAITVSVEIGARDVSARVWLVVAGHMRLYLLDTDVEGNTDEDRAITYQLYGGDDETRIQQEMVLGIGGVRALRAAGLSPTVWHLNEGHAAFAPLELARELVVVGSDFSSALEAVAASTVFTTHTPVPAGHDRFSESLVEHYLARFAYELRLRTNELMALGELPGESGGLNMTTLAIRSSRHHNGVSKIHGHVSSEICQPCWPEISPADNPITSITNGVHVLTVLASEWVDLFDREVGTQWRAAVTDVDYWERLQGISPQQFWSTRQAIKSKMLADMRDVLTAQYTRNGMNASRMAHRLRFMDPNNPNILTVGFARRFATYKRATLLLTDVERLIRIAADAERPVVFLFAGKAHPADIPGQQLLRELHEITERPELDGRILLLEGYDLTLARRLLSGVDVWLNNPVYPLEASGTSGMKAAMNGAINLSVADGWWAEADQGDNGWTIHPSSHPDHFHRDREDAQTLYRLLEHEVVPRYYQASDDGYSPEWVVMAKRSMASVLPRFCMDRMVQEYTEQLYVPAARHGSRLNADNAGLARELANWKQRVATAWPGVAIRTLQAPASELSYGEPLRLEVAVQLGGLISQDVAVELVVTGFERTSSSIREGVREGAAVHGSHKRTYVSRFSAIEAADTEEGEARFWLEYEPPTTGRFEYQVRVYPHHDALAHPFEVGLMRWVK